ncbi:ribbon-helix-helix domain-containing protein [Burkholderia contaminans]|uniref:ribbon-helix-helix domain-containing protein n=1 Tax=Burkholderia contaminans TaxID=488447 RepID=UPI00158C580A|nr:AlpA family phage regulatory protein [Burkholderia contaminans]
MATKNAQGAGLRAKQAAAYLGISVTSLWRFARTNPSFPQPVRVTDGVTVFLTDELDAWLAEKSKRTGNAPDEVRTPDRNKPHGIATNIYLPKAVRERLDEAARLTGRSMASIVSEAVQTYCDKHKIEPEYRIRPSASHPWGRATCEQAIQARDFGWEVQQVKE